MLSLDQIKTALQDRRLSVIAEATGISFPTISSIRSGDNTNPTLNVVQKLSDYLEGKPVNPNQ